MKKLFLRFIYFLLISVFLCQLPVGAVSTTDYIISEGKKVETPLCYYPNKVISYLGKNVGSFIGATDLFVDKSDNMYITDANNNRIIKLDSEGNFLRTYNNSGDLSAPSCVYVTETGDLFIADSGNQRIVHVDKDDKLVEVFGKPESSLLADDFDYTVKKFAISKQGIIYVIHSQYFMMIDTNNEFKGYYASNKVGFNLKEFLIRTFGNENQKKNMAYSQADTYNSFEIGDDGFIYAVANKTNSPICVLNSDGENLFKAQENPIKVMEDKSTTLFDPQLVDICVDDNSTIFTLEKHGCYIYVYDKEGNMLSMFGGIGSIKGKFVNPVAVDTNSKGETLVLDSANGTIHCFKPTNYMEKIREAHNLFNNGKYDESFDKWSEVLEINVNCSLANSGIGKILYKQQKYKEAMGYFKRANDKVNYAKAFSKYRHSIFRDYFGFVVFGIAVLVFLIIFTVIKLRKRATKAVEKYYFGRMKRRL